MRNPVCLIVHTDTVFSEMYLHHNFTKESIEGTLDNFIGIAVVFRLLDFINRFHIQIYFTQYEEVNLWGANVIANEIKNGLLKETTIPIVIDVANVRGKYDCSLENIYGFTDQKIKDMKETIENHNGLRCKTKKYTGKPEDEDDSWAFIEKGIKTLSYIIPVQGYFHTLDCTVSIGAIIKATQGLKWLLSYFLSNEYPLSSVRKRAAKT